MEYLASLGGAREAVVFFHGYGANMEDLAPLAAVLGGSRYDWYFPNGLLDLHAGARAWFALEITALEKFFTTGKRDFFHSPPFRSSVEKALDTVGAFLESIPQEKIFLGGFSQGSSLGLALALRSPKKVKKLIVLSGLFLEKTLWGSLPSSLGAESFQTHGYGDPLVPFREGERLASFLREMNPNHCFIPFEGGHEVGPCVLPPLRDFLRGH